MRGKTHAAILRRRRAASPTGVAFNDLPVVIADPADNAGGGAPSDNTDILRHLIERKVENACVGPIWDPIAVRLCFDAGLGATVPAALRRQDRRRPRASRSMPRSRSSACKRDAWQSFGPTQVPVGDCAAVRVGGVEVVLIANRTQALGLELFTNLGIDPRAEEDRGGEVDQPLHGGLRADRQEGDLRRIPTAR